MGSVFFEYNDVIFKRGAMRMNKEEFLRRLEALLSDISDEERAEAMAFYHSYFEDAGEGNEANILAELESPEKVAETIKKDLGMVVVVNKQNSSDTEEASGSTNNGAGYANNGAGSTGYANAYGYGNSGAGYANNGAGNTGYAGSNWNADSQPEKKDSNIAVIVLVVILAVVTSPAWLGLIGGLLGALFGILVSIVAVTIALFATAIGLLIGGISCLATGMIATGFALTGASLFVLAFAILALLATVWLYGGFLPWLVKAIVKLVKKITGGRKEQRVA